MEVIIIASLTLFFTVLLFINSITSWFKKKVPIKFGFIYNDHIVDTLEVNSGDSEKVIQFRFLNTTESTIKDIIIEFKMIRPLSLSGSNHALTVSSNTKHGPSKGNMYYLIEYSDLIFLGKKYKDFKVELNTKGKSPGDYRIAVNVYSKSDKFKLISKDLILNIK